MVVVRIGINHTLVFKDALINPFFYIEKPNPTLQINSKLYESIRLIALEWYTVHEINVPAKITDGAGSKVTCKSCDEYIWKRLK